MQLSVLCCDSQLSQLVQTKEPQVRAVIWASEAITFNFAPPDFQHDLGQVI